MDNVPAFSPADFVASVNQTFEYAYPSVAIVGELAHFKVSKGKWVYFDLKDDTASVKFFGSVYQLPGPLEDGMVVRVSGMPRLSPLYGFSVSFQNIVPVGEGSLKRAADLLKQKLTKEGLFDTSRKRLLPHPPRRIGLVTSAESAAYEDFLKILNARWGDIEVIHANVGVQGEAAIQEVAAAIERLNHTRDIEVIVVTRGGGGADDLAVFSTEPVTRAVAASRVPTLVAIGHEMDVSLAELAADVRASTPSNAAELLVPDRRHIHRQLHEERALFAGLLHDIHVAATRQLGDDRQDMYDRTMRLLTHAVDSTADAQTLLNALNPTHALKRGYAVLRSNGQTITSVGQVVPGDIIEARVSDGSFRVEVQ